MLPHQKAVPRIAFMAEEQSGKQLDIQIIPTGIYYSHYWKFNRTLIVNFGEPIPVKKYREIYNANPNAATIALKNDIYNALLSLTINIKSREHYNEFEHIREIYGKHFLKRQSLKNTVLNRFKSDQLLVKKLDELEVNNPVSAASLARNTNIIHEKINNLGLRSWLVTSGEKHFGKLSANMLLLLAGLPLFLYGFLFNFIPFFLIDRIVRNKIKDKSFWSTFFLVPGLILFPLFYLIGFLAVSWMIPGVLLKIAFIVSLPFVGKLAFKWYLILLKTVGRLRLMQLKWFQPEKINQLFNEKNRLFEKLDNLLSIN
jgi:hypothetical protein